MHASCCVQIHGRELWAPTRPAGDLQYNRCALQFVLLGVCLNSGKISVLQQRPCRVCQEERLRGVAVR
jgi:hypothetical protein